MSFLPEDEEPNSKTMLKVMDPSLHQMPLSRRRSNQDSDDEDVNLMNNSMARHGVEAKIEFKRPSLFHRQSEVLDLKMKMQEKEYEIARLMQD